MSAVILQCVICGWSILMEDDCYSWTIQFRGVCSSREGGAYVTGVGLFQNPRPARFTAPPSYDARWDGPGYGFLNEWEFGVLARREINGKRGFVFHDACWSLVKMAYHPAPVPYERLFEVLDSLPMIETAYTLDWGHDYGELALLRNEENYFPWEYLRFTHRDFEDGSNAMYKINPLAQSEVEGILAEAPQTPPSQDSVLSTRSSSSGRDPFTLLPEELCSAVAAYLPTPSVLNARRASRSFWLVFDSQHFWASRFKGNASERAWLFEVAQDLEVPGGIGRRDWRWLYHRTLDSRLGPGARNRTRIWRLIQHVADLLALSWNELPLNMPLPFQIPSLPEHESPSPPWIVAAGSIREWGKAFRQLHASCARSKVQRVAIPTDDISRITASTVCLGGSRYIAGLSLTATNGAVVHLGYRAASSERSLQVEGAALTGFNLAIGLGGIHALQCVSGSGLGRQESAWLGDPSNGPKTERLSRVTTSGQTMLLELGFDGLRMVSLAVYRQSSGEVPTAQGANEDSNNLRNSAIWYPQPPHRTMNLNEHFLVTPDTYKSGYRPLFWTWFGGPGGSLLRSLVKIKIIGSVGRIYFIFKRPGMTTECQSFGRIDLDDSEERENEEDKPVEFSIDGPSGETIHKVEICQVMLTSGPVDWLSQEGFLTWLKIHTNHGRTCKVGHRHKPRNNKSVVRKEFLAAPGTAITGFYGAQYRHHTHNISSFGVITEQILPG